MGSPGLGKRGFSQAALTQDHLLIRTGLAWAGPGHRNSPRRRLANPACDAIRNYDKRSNLVPESKSYHYIIVGAGSAGCVLANRLSEDESTSVLLIEAGGYDRHPLVHVPIGLGKLHQYRIYDWGLTAEPDPALCGRAIPTLRGKVLGGSHSINVMAYTRGDHADYDRWAREGADGWSFAEVLPYFKRSETWEGGEDTWRGGGGPVHTQFAHAQDPVFSAWMEAGREAGFSVTQDFNGRTHEGFGAVQQTIRNGRRDSTATAYLRPVLGRRNLTLVTNAHVTRVVMAGTCATGVEYDRNGKIDRVTADREVILCAGAYHSPQLLMLSGIGPSEHLSSLGIDVRIDLPVGEDLQDHLAAWFNWARPTPGPFHDLMRLDRIAMAMTRAYLFGSGPGTMLPTGIFAFIKTRPELEAPDIEFIFRAVSGTAHIWFPPFWPAFKDAIAIRPTLLHPKSRGKILLRSASPFDKPRIFNNFLQHPNDLKTLIDGTKIGLDLASRAPLAPFRGKPVGPAAIRSDDDIERWIRQTAITVNHPCGTCGIGRVVDSELRVRGAEHLRVVDASAMPTIVSAHINACVLMMAEKAADLIRRR
jgi:4-pyridoxate dehydrogenase